MYLQHALKNGSANVVIDGLSQSGENYEVAVECLQSRYDRPRFIHQAHVKIILDAPSLKEGTGRELRKLHDLAQQHLRALKSMDYDPGPFMTSVLELKLDATTTFEWQKHGQAQSKVPHYQDLLDFINLRAQASESPSQQHLKRTNKADMKRFPKVATFAASYESGAKCISCKTENHPLYVCPTFRAMSHDNKIALLKEKKLCMNCLNSGHFIKTANRFTDVKGVRDPTIPYCTWKKLITRPLPSHTLTQFQLFRPQRSL